MRYTRHGRRIAALALTVTAMVAGCTAGIPASGPTSAAASPTSAAASPAAVAPASASRAAVGPAAVGPAAGAAGTLPPVFAASLSFLSPKSDHGALGERIALLSSRTGDLLRWLTPQQDGTFDAVLSVYDGWVYFLRGVASVSVWRVPVAGGRARLVLAGATAYALSPDGRAVAYVTSADHGNVLDLVARNLVTGRQNTVVMSMRPDPDANNWPPGVSSLTWAPDDVHLAVQFELTAAISRVLVFDAFTARTLGDARTAPSPCAVTSKPVCEEFDPAYLASGALTYVVQRLSGSGTARASLIASQAGRRTTLFSFPGGTFPMYDMTAQGQAIWADYPARPTGPWPIWRWSGGTPVEITALPPLGASPYYGLGGVAW
jgi:hypothetical protein